MEDAGPDEGIKFELGGHWRDTMDKEMIVKVLADGEEIVVKLFDLFVLAEHLNILHLGVDHVIKTFD